MSSLSIALIVFVVVLVISIAIAFFESLDNAETGISTPAENIASVVAGISALIVAGIVGALIRQHLYH